MVLGGRSWYNVFVLLVFLCADGIEGLFCRELGIKYTEFEHIVVGHVSSMWYLLCHVSIM